MFFALSNPFLTGFLPFPSCFCPLTPLTKDCLCLRRPLEAHALDGGVVGVVLLQVDGGAVLHFGGCAAIHVLRPGRFLARRKDFSFVDISLNDYVFILKYDKK